MKNCISRRSFLKAAGILGAAGSTEAQERTTEALAVKLL